MMKKLFDRLVNFMDENNLMLRKWRYQGKWNLAFVDKARKKDNTIYADDPVDLGDLELEQKGNNVIVRYKGATEIF